MQSISTNFNQLLISLKERLIKSINYTEISSLILLFVNIVIFLIGGSSIVKRNMTIGEFTIINTYFNTIFSIFKYFLELGDNYQTAKVALIRITELSKIPIDINGSEIVDDLKNITLENVTFSYDNNKLIFNLNYKFKKGYIYVIDGCNGAGKSTLMSLLMGIYTGYYEGNILFNYVDISDIDMYTFRKNMIGFCPQEISCDNQLRNINSNIIKDYGFNSLIDDFNISDKINFENIKELSGGEKKKIRLLKILTKFPQLILLDEPEVALDTKSKEALLEWLKKYKSNSIVIIISHNPELINFADDIIKLS